jgi:tRNA uridine 5-carboxymethylaminomethyl modification enzyme
MFTSRSELRLLLRIDNADARLMPAGLDLGLVSREACDACRRKYEEAARMREFLREARWDPDVLPLGGADPAASRGSTLEQLLRRPGNALSDFEPVMRSHGVWLSEEARRSVEIEVRYQGYISQQQRDAERIRGLSLRRIPEGFDYGRVSGLSREIREKLERVRPRDLASARRIPGVTPAAVSILNVHLELERRSRRDGSRPGRSGS